MDHIFEILLRLVRGDRSSSSSNPNSNSNSNQQTITTPSSLNGPLASAVTEGGFYAKGQNHVSLSVLALLRLTNEMAEKAGVKKGVVDDRVSESEWKRTLHRREEQRRKGTRQKLTSRRSFQQSFVPSLNTSSSSRSMDSSGSGCRIESTRSIRLVSSAFSRFSFSRRHESHRLVFRSRFPLSAFLPSPKP